MIAFKLEEIVRLDKKSSIRRRGLIYKKSSSGIPIHILVITSAQNLGSLPEGTYLFFDRRTAFCLVVTKYIKILTTLNNLNKTLIQLSKKWPWIVV
jgi:hypothetical protein